MVRHRDSAMEFVGYFFLYLLGILMLILGFRWFNQELSALMACLTGC